MVETKAVSDRCRALNFRSWLMKTSLMNAFALVSLQRIQEFHLWPLNTSTPKPSLFNPQRSPSGTPRDDRTRPTDRQTHNTHTKRAHTTKKRISCRVCFFACLWRVFGRLTDAAQNAVGVFFFLLWVVFVWLVNLSSRFQVFVSNQQIERLQEGSRIPNPPPDTGHPQRPPRHRPPRTRPRARKRKVNYFFRAEDLGTLRMRDNDTRRGDMKNGNGVIGLVEGGATSPPWSTRPPLPTSRKNTDPFGICVSAGGVGRIWRGVRPRRCLFFVANLLFHANVYTAKTPALNTLIFSK